MVSWTRPPRRAVAVIIRVGRKQARVSPDRQTWTGGRLRLGRRLITVRSVDADGATLSLQRRMVYAISPGDQRFRYLFHLWRAYLD